MKTKRFDDILNDCLERMISGETIEQCLTSYPEQANDLRPLLHTTMTARRMAMVQPRAEFRARARYELQTLMNEAAAKKKRRFSFSLNWMPQWATVTAVVLVFVLAGGGTVAASSNSMPDQPLYPVKLATEQAKLTLTWSDLDKANVYAALVDRRVQEIVYSATKGDAEEVEHITERMDQQLVSLVRLAASSKEDAGALKAMAPPQSTSTPPTPVPPQPAAQERGQDKQGGSENKQAKLKESVSANAKNHSEAMRAALDKAPDSAKAALRRAIAISEADYEEAIKALED